MNEPNIPKQKTDNLALRLRRVTKQRTMVFKSGSRIGSFIYRQLQEKINEKQFLALHDISFNVEKGKMVVLIGENGAGKTTLLQAIAGITPIDSGRIHVDGKIGAMLELGFSFHPDLNGYENCYLQGAVLGMPREQISELLPSIIDYAGIAHAMELPVRYYSTGMFMRLAFSLSIHIDPDILLIDEILGVGDLEFQLRSFNRILDMRDAGKTVILVSHLLPTAAMICDEAIWLSEGRVVEVGPAEKVIKNYQRWANFRLIDRGEKEHSRFGFIEEERRRKKTTRMKLVEQVTERFEATIHSVRIVDDVGNEVSSVKPFDALRVAIDYTAVRVPDGAFLKCLIVNDDGIIVMEQKTGELNKESGFNLDGEVVFEIAPLQLMQGHYRVVGGFFHEGDANKDIRLLEKDVEFAVVPNHEAHPDIIGEPRVRAKRIK